MQRVSAELEARCVSRDVNLPTDASLWTDRLIEGLILPPASGDGRLEHFRARSVPEFFHGVRDRASATALRTSRWADAVAALVTAADRVREGRYDLLGHVGLSFGARPDWHLDPTSGRQSPRTHWSRIPYLDPAVVGDHKVVWEINRHQHFVVLGRAYQVTGDARYAQCWVEQLTSWMDANPPKQGVNWASSLEVSYRAISWLWALELFRGAPELTADLLDRLLRYLYLHGRHIERYLSTYFSPNTHLTGEALGLLYLGTVLPELRRAHRWRELGWSILERELPRQVHADGVYFEQATYYHRYTVDIYLHALLLARADGREIPPAMKERLVLAVEHLADLMRPDGTVPIIGDDDGGRLVSLEDRRHADVRAALGTAAIVLDRPWLARVAGGATEEVLWLLGPDGGRAADDAATGREPDHDSRLFPHGGYAIMRDGWSSRANHAVIDCGPHGTMNCGHAHSDALSIEITARGHPTIVDPGTFTYTGSASDRDHFRHSAAHNTVTVDGQSASVPAGPFSWRSKTDVRIESWWAGTLCDYFVGGHDGFARLADPVRHTRRVLFARDGYWVIVDRMECTGEHEVVAHFHTAIGSMVSSRSARSALVRGGDGVDAPRLLIVAGGDLDAMSWNKDWVSPAYGARTLAPVVRLVSAGIGRRDIITILVAIDGDSEPAVHEEECENGYAFVIERDQGRDTVLLPRGGTLRADGIEVNADAALVRRAPEIGHASRVALFGTHARLVMRGHIFEATVAAEFGRVDGTWSTTGEGRVTGRVQPPR